MSGESVIGEESVVSFSATIDFENPEQPIVGQHQRNKGLYKEHRTECRTDFADFEDAVFEVAASLAVKKK